MDEGIAEIRKALEMDPNNIFFRADLCYLLCRSGKKDEARNILVQAQAGLHHISPVAIAGIYACLGEKGNAMEWLEKAYLEHSPYLASLGVERWFDGIRDNQQFVALLRTLRLKD